MKEGTGPHPFVELFRDTAGKWRWRLRARNAEVLASSEAYSSKTKARKTAGRVAAVIGVGIVER